MITQEELKRMFYYDGTVGGLIRKHTTSGRARKGQVAGSIKPSGYSQIGIRGVYYMTHRLIWLYIHGYFPENDIDHINRDASDNRIENLRVVSRSCNMRNTGTRKDNVSGIKGVTPAGTKWAATIVCNGKPQHLGTYEDIGEAAAIRYAYEQCLGWSSCDNNSTARDYTKGLTYEH